MKTMTVTALAMAIIFSSLLFSGNSAIAYEVSDYNNFDTFDNQITTLKAKVEQEENTPAIKAKVTQEEFLQNAFSQPSGPGVVGIDFRIRPNQLPYVADVFPGTPAFYAGVMPGDKIIAINGQSTLAMSSQDVDTAISDRPGDTVNLLIDHKGQTTSRAVVVMSLALVPSAIIRNQFNDIYP